ncbi:protein tyrosine phosphatase family protein [Sphingomonas sp.]|uniref:protein tyrosine phosphatase family protein n=1 Tax=Sphingomonas sp. TaxID=28214 RepID=UPI0033423F7C
MSDPIHIQNWQRLDALITTSGQPSEGELAEIAALGVCHVINLGLHSHERALPDEAASVGAAGMTYTHIPVAFDAPTQADFARFCAVLAGIGAAPVHVHCIMNWRVSAFFYRYRRDVLGWEDAAARAPMEALWQPGGVWAAFIGDTASIAVPHRLARA